MSSKFVRVAAVGEIPPGQAKVVMVGRREIALFNIDGSFHAIENTCPHQGGPLAEGWLDGPVVTCPWHGWCFDVRTGKMTLGDYALVDAFEVRVDGAAITVATEPVRNRS